MRRISPREFVGLFSGPKSAIATPAPAGPTLPEVASATLLLNLQADALELSDNDPVGTWADASGNGYDFTQTGAARPTYKAGGGIPYLDFPTGGGKWLNGQNWNAFDNLEAFTVFIVSDFTYPGDGEYAYGYLIRKYDDVNGVGWDTELDYYMSLWANYEDFIQIFSAYVHGDVVPYGGRRITAHIKNSNSDLQLFVDGTQAGHLTSFGNPVTSFSNTEVVQIGIPFEFAQVIAYKIHGILMYLGVPNTSDRQAIEAWLAAKYGVTLP